MSFEMIPIRDKVVNCYLLKTGEGFVMVDCGAVFSRGGVKKALAGAGCKPGDLKLVILTHGDYDHTGNCVYLRKKYGAGIAVHRDEAPAVETGNMFTTRKTRLGAVMRFFMWLFGLLLGRKLKPDVLLEDGDDLTAYGLNAKIIHTPGHTLGSISILTAEGDLFCGDFLTGGQTPQINHLVDDMDAMKAGVARIKDLSIKRIYPGHGRAFSLQELMDNYG